MIKLCKRILLNVWYFLCSFAVVCWETIVRRKPHDHFRDNRHTENVEFQYIDEVKVRVCCKDMREAARPDLKLLEKPNSDSEYGVNPSLVEEMTKILIDCWSTEPSNRCRKYNTVRANLEKLINDCQESPEETTLFEETLKELQTKLLID